MKIKKAKAKMIYPVAPDWFKKELVEAFGEDCFKKKNFDEIKTFDDACRAIGTTEEKFNIKFEKLGLDPDTLAYEKVKVVAKAINDGWVPDWNDSNQYKYYPYFKVLSSGSGFSNSSFRSAGTITGVGSRLCYESSEKAKYAATQFVDIYNQFLL